MNPLTDLPQSLIRGYSRPTQILLALKGSKLSGMTLKEKVWIAGKAGFPN